MSNLFPLRLQLQSHTTTTTSNKRNIGSDLIRIHDGDVREGFSSGGLLRIYLNSQTKVLGVRDLEEVSNSGDGGVAGQVLLGKL